MAIRAVVHLRRLRGGAQSHLMRCEDGHYYVVKFQNNPQGVRILANEMLAARLALALGLPVSEPQVVEVSDWLVERTPELHIQFGDQRVRCASGLQFGSRFPCNPLHTPVYDFLPDAQLDTVVNRDSFRGMLVFDKWTCNCDSRQSVFHRPVSGDSSQYVATMVDDSRVESYARARFLDRYGFREDIVSLRASTRAKLNTECERAKIGLSSRTTEKIQLRHYFSRESLDYDLDEEISRANFESMITVDIDAALRQVDKAIDDAALTPQEIDAALLLNLA